MRFILAVLGGILGAGLGLVAGWGAGEVLARVLNISCFEGGCGYFVALIALLGGVAGLAAGILAVLLRKRRDGVGSPDTAQGAGGRRALRTSGQFLGSVAVIAGLAIGGVWAYVWISDDSLGGHNQAAPRLYYEVRFPAGTPLPERKSGVNVQLHTEKNQAWGDLHDDWQRSDGDRPVVAGFFELYYRVRSRVLSVRLPGGPEYVFILKLPRAPKHMPELTEWYQADSIGDGSGETRPATASDDVQIRYRVVYAGQE